MNKLIEDLVIKFTTALGTILDPKFKNLTLQDPNACWRRITKLKIIIEEGIITSTRGTDEEVVHE